MKRKKDLSVWDVEKQLWRVPSGNFTFHIGHSSRKLVSKLELELDVEL